MSYLDNISKNFFTKQEIAGSESINDLRDKEFSGQHLSAEEKFALANYDKYRLNVLNAQENEEQFHLHYRQLQVIANLGDWKDFLKEDFSK